MPKITGCGVIPLDQRQGRGFTNPALYGFTDLIEKAAEAGVEVWIHSHNSRPTREFPGFALHTPQPPRPPEERVVVESLDDARALMKAMTS